MKKENSVRFSLVSKSRKSDSTPSRSESRASNRLTEPQNGGFKIYSPQDMEGDRSPFVHMRVLSDGVIVEDVSGRQRVLPMDQIAYIYSIIRADSSSIPVKSKISSIQSQAELSLQAGHLTTAIATYKGILDILLKYHTLDTDLRIKAGILHRIGFVYIAIVSAG
jgi:hypothetical protein